MSFAYFQNVRALAQFLENTKKKTHFKSIILAALANTKKKSRLVYKPERDREQSWAFFFDLMMSLVSRVKWGKRLCTLTTAATTNHFYKKPYIHIYALLFLYTQFFMKRKIMQKCVGRFVSIESKFRNVVRKRNKICKIQKTSSFQNYSPE